MRGTTEEAAPDQISELQAPEPQAPQRRSRPSVRRNYMTSLCIELKEETRMLGAIQVMVGLIHSVLGYIWMQLYIRNFDSVSVTYVPMALISGYPFWASVFYVVSGVFAIGAEKTHSPKLLRYTIIVNGNSFVLAGIGLFLIAFEIFFFLLKRVKIIWIQHSAMILSAYLWLFSMLELLLARTVTKWGIEPSYRGNNLR